LTVTERTGRTVRVGRELATADSIERSLNKRGCPFIPMPSPSPRVTNALATTENV
jgi:hypothetical protein